MSIALAKRIKQEKFESKSQEVLLDLLVAASEIRVRLERVYSNFGISLAQYNLLRILKGAYPEGRARFDISDRMIDRSPDVTRLIDRLRKLGLVERVRSQSDKRVSKARITRAGIGLLEELQSDLEETQRKLLSNLTDKEQTLFSHLCGRIIESPD
jgi:DNA-binding MarR family transcriptional regulator